MNGQHAFTFWLDKVLSRNIAKWEGKIFMTKANFQGMTKQELRAYVLKHRDDREAFYALTDKLREEPGIEITSTEQMHELIEARLDEADVRDAYAALEEISMLGTIPFEEIKRELGI